LSKISDINAKVASPDEYTLVVGHGKPYGTTYPILEQRQGLLTPDTHMLALGNGLYLRFLSKIPIVSDELKIDPTPFYGQKPLLYFASNSITMDVKKWVFDDGLANFSLIPISAKSTVPPVRITPRFAYLTMNLFMNMDLYYKPLSPDKAREILPLGITTSDWPYDRDQYFLEYKHFGPYGRPADSNPVMEEQELIADSVKKIEAIIKEDTKESAESASKAGDATKVTADQASKETEKFSKREQGANLDDSKESTSL